MLRRNVRKMREDETVNIKELLYPDKEEAKALKKETEDVVLSSVSETPEQRRNRLLSKAIWISNPGYLYPIPSLWQTTSQDYAWNEKEIEYMAEKGLLQKMFNRKRDTFTKYVEAKAQAKKLQQHN